MAKKNTGNSPAFINDKNDKPSLKDLFNKMLTIEDGQTLILENLRGMNERLTLIEADFRNLARSSTAQRPLSGSLGWTKRKVKM